MICACSMFSYWETCTPNCSHAQGDEKAMAVIDATVARVAMVVMLGLVLHSDTGANCSSGGIGCNFCSYAIAAPKTRLLWSQ